MNWDEKHFKSKIKNFTKELSFFNFPIKFSIRKLIELSLWPTSSFFYDSFLTVHSEKRNQGKVKV